MRLLHGLLSYLIAAVAVVGGAAAFLSFAGEPSVRMVPGQQETRKVAPRIQRWLDRNAEGLIYAEKEKADTFAEKERVEALRIKIPSTAENAAMAQAYDKKEKQAAERESATRTKESAKREARSRSRQLEQVEAKQRMAMPRRLDGPRVCCSMRQNNSSDRAFSCR